jgi:hypothetical protein
MVTLIQRKTFWKDAEHQNIKMYIDFFLILNLVIEINSLDFQV